MAAKETLLQEATVDIKKKVTPAPAWWEEGGTTEELEGCVPRGK